MSLAKLSAKMGVGIITLLLTGSVFGIRYYETRHKYNHYTNSHQVIKNISNLSDKVCIITGCNTGIGKETVKQLYIAGCIVIMACRNEKKANKAREDIIQEINGNEQYLIIIQLDLGDLKSVDEFVMNFNKNNIVNGKLDYLINNAGVMSSEFQTTKNENLEMQFGVNHIGHFYLTNKLLPILKRNKTRVINVASMAHFFCDALIMRQMLDSGSKQGPIPTVIPFDQMKYYAISKMCNILFTRHLNRLYHCDGITALCVHPGYIKTELDRNLNSVSIGISNFLLYPMMKTISQGAATTLRCVTITDKEIYNEDIKDIGNMALYFDDCRAQNDKLHQDIRNGNNKDIDDQLWEYSKMIIKGFDYLKLNE